MPDSKRKFGFYITPAYQSSAGIEKYARTLVRGIYQSELADRVVMLCARDSPHQGWVDRLVGGKPIEARSNLPRLLLRYAWAYFGKPTADALAREHLAFAHSPHAIRIPTENSPLIITVHDLIPEKFPHWLGARDKLLLYRQLQLKAIRHADRLIAVSYSTKRDLIEITRVPEERITVIHQGVDHRVFRPVEDVDRVRQTLNMYGINGAFVLYVGSLYSRKMGKLLEAYKILCSRTKSPPKLVVVGGRQSLNPRYKNLSELLAALNLQQNVLHVGFVPDENLPVLMSAAEVYVFVSLYEGFGIGPLEAMACGTPVIVSSTSSLPEVVGDAGLLVDPTNQEEIASAIERLLESNSLREELRRRSVAQAALFSWERTAQQTLDIYRTMLH
jgi:glycosyltransferase involved in cell wall biosynthesis